MAAGRVRTVPSTTGAAEARSTASAARTYLSQDTLEQDRPYALLEAFDPGSIELWRPKGQEMLAERVRAAWPMIPDASQSYHRLYHRTYLGGSQPNRITKEAS